MTKPEAVTQEDRDAAAALVENDTMMNEPIRHYDEAGYRYGSNDDGALVQAFARHRIAAEQRGMERERERWERLHADNVACYEKACAEREHFRSLAIRQGEQA